MSQDVSWLVVVVVVVGMFQQFWPLASCWRLLAAADRSPVQ